MMAVILALAAVLITICLSFIGYRRWLHPLSHFPGPFLASVTGLYRTYWSFQPSFALNFARLHEKYGKRLGALPTSHGAGLINAVLYTRADRAV